MPWKINIREWISRVRGSRRSEGDDDWDRESITDMDPLPQASPGTPASTSSERGVAGSNSSERAGRAATAPATTTNTTEGVMMTPDSIPSLRYTTYTGSPESGGDNDTPAPAPAATAAATVSGASATAAAEAAAAATAAVQAAAAALAAAGRGCPDAAAAHRRVRFAGLLSRGASNDSTRTMHNSVRTGSSPGDHHQHIGGRNSGSPTLVRAVPPQQPTRAEIMAMPGMQRLSAPQMCRDCGCWFTESHNSPVACNSHPGSVFFLQAEWMAYVPVALTSNRWDTRYTPDKFVWTCCGQQCGATSGCVHRRHRAHAHDARVRAPAPAPAPSRFPVPAPVPDQVPVASRLSAPSSSTSPSSPSFSSSLPPLPPSPPPPAAGTPAADFDPATATPDSVPATATPDSSSSSPPSSSSPATPPPVHPHHDPAGAAFLLSPLLQFRGEDASAWGLSL